MRLSDFFKKGFWSDKSAEGEKNVNTTFQTTFSVSEDEKFFAQKIIS